MATSISGSGIDAGRGCGSRVAQINITPMIDILLVLLIIFMVIAPVTPRGLPALLPHPASPGSAARDDAVVVQVIRRPGAPLSYRVNDAAVAHGAILAKLVEIFGGRADRTLFVEGEGQLKFADVADLIDIGRAANADRIGLMTPGSRPAE